MPLGNFKRRIVGQAAKERFVTGGPHAGAAHFPRRAGFVETMPDRGDFLRRQTRKFGKDFGSTHARIVARS